MKLWHIATVCLLVASVTQTRAHDWYKDLKQPDNGNSCCNSLQYSHTGDCRNVRAKVDIDGRWQIYVKELNEWYYVPQNKILKDVVAPDARCHACYRIHKWNYMKLQVLCFIPCGSSS